MPAAEVQMEMMQPDPMKVKLLLVDDSPENLVALEATLEGLGQELIKASSGVEALRHLLDNDFAAILLDVRMPGMDGFETAAMIRSRKRSRNTPILFLTGYKNEEHLFRGYDLGAVDFLFKPIVPEILQSKVAVFVELCRNSILLRRQAEELRAAEASMRAVLEAAPEAMIIFGADHAIRSVNTEAEKLFGYSRSELIGQPVARLSPEWFRVRTATPNEILCITKTGITFPAEVSLKPVESNDLGTVVSVIRDITDRKLAQENARRVTLELERQVAERTRELRIDIAERKRAEMALRDSEQSLRIAIQAAGLGLWRIDVERGSMQVSTLTREIFGLRQDAAEIPLAEWKARLHPDDRARVSDELEGCISSLCDYESEYRIVRADGAVHWIYSKGQPFAREEDRPMLVVGIAQDVTQRRLAHEAERHRQKLESLGILAGGIAHDFNNLLTGILGNASLLLESAQEESFEKQSLCELLQAGERAAQLTRQMLAYSGRGKFVTSEIVVGDELREIAALVRASIPKQVQVRFELSRNEPSIQGDKSQIQQLLMNLVINGAEAIRAEGGFVRIVTRREVLGEKTGGFYPADELPAGDYLVTEIQDNGHGMTQDTLARIFDPFFTTKFTGRGLGLAAALGIVRGHRGGIQVRSAPGEGTTFRVYLPVSTRPLKAVAEEEPVEGGVGEGHGTILVVDDEEIVRNVAKSSLERRGYTVLLADSGEQALRILDSNAAAVRLVLLDLEMPGMGGAETLKRIRQMVPEAPVVASSGYSEARASEQFGEGAAGFLQKPYGVRQLVAKVHALLLAQGTRGEEVIFSRGKSEVPGRRR
jgi:PAS domain S-box-containing protein